MSVARLYGLLVASLVGMLLVLGATGASHARESYLSTIYTLSPHGYAAADPMAGLVRSPFKPRATLRSAPGAHCLASKFQSTADPDAPRLECIDDQLPVAALRDMRTLTNPVPQLRVVLSRWTEVAGPTLPATVLEPRDRGWVAMAEFGTPEELPSQSGPVRAGFYSLF